MTLTIQRPIFDVHEGHDWVFTPQVETRDGGLNEGVNEGVNKVLNFINESPGSRVPGIAKGTGIPEKTVERHIKSLRNENKIYFVGAPKSGGYWVVEGEG